MLAKRPKRLLSALRAAFRIVLFLSPFLFGFLPPALAIETIAEQAFLIDMSNLEGVLRALSFIGLGAVLIGIGLFYQKILTRKPQA